MVIRRYVVVLLSILVSTLVIAGEIKIQGWNILSDDVDHGIKAIEKAKEYNINHLQLSHAIIRDLKDVRERENFDVYRKLLDKAKENGIKEVTVWDHALYDLDYYPDKFRTGPGRKIDLDNLEFWKWFKNDYRDMLDKAGDGLDGIILTFIETGAHVEDQYSEKMKTEEEKLAYLVDQVADVVVKEKGLKLYIRTFIYTRTELKSILKCLDLIESQEIIVMMKETQHDFFLTHPNRQDIDKVKRPVIIEFDAAREYEGQGVIANTFSDAFRKRWKYFLGKENVIGYVARTDRFGDTSIIGRPSEINLYVLKRLIERQGISNDNLLEEFITKRYGKKSTPYLKVAFDKAEYIVKSSIYTLGLNTANHSDFAFDYISSYTRYVSGRWMAKPVFYIGHGVDREFHYYKDVMNILSPGRFKTKGERLEREDPWLFEKEWLDLNEEKMNEEYYEMILKEKIYSVSLAKSALEYVKKAKPYLSNEDYKNVYRTFEKTLLTVKHRRAGAKAYYGYRIWCRGKKFQSKILLDNIWDGLNELKKTGKKIKNYPGKVPCGEWDWRDDYKRGEKYYKRIAIEGWDQYGGPIPRK